MRPITTRRQALAGMLGTAAALGAGGALTAAGTATAGSVTSRARALARRMTLEEKIGQLFVVEVAGQDAHEVTAAAAAVNQRRYGVSTPAEVVRKYRPGAVIYFSAREDDNLHNPRQIARLSNGLQEVSLGQRNGTPLIISTDQEGGIVFRLPTPPATELPGNMALGATGSADDAYRNGQIIGRELAALGINQNYGPVADVNVNPENPVIGVRSFGAEPQAVARLVAAAVHGQRNGGIASAAKHFPGHGDTGEDSHTSLPEMKHTLQQIHDIDLPPFRAAIEAGVDTIMTAHIIVPALEEGVPATMSRRILTGLLREELGYDGLIVTDALDMQGATSQYPPDKAPVAAFQAGADMLVLAPEMDVAHAAVLAAARSGEISAQRVEESVVRILVRKLREGLFDDPLVSERRAERVVGNDQHLASAAAYTGRAITLVKNEGGALPLAPGTPRKVLVTGWGVTTTARLAQSVAARGGQTVTTKETGAVPSQAVIDATAAAAAEHDLVLVSAYAAAAGGTELGAAQAALVEALLGTGTQVVVIGVRNPYDIRRFTGVPSYLCTYGYGVTLLESAVKAVYGELNPSGTLPVAITAFQDPDTELYPLGHGLSY